MRDLAALVDHARFVGEVEILEISAPFFDSPASATSNVGENSRSNDGQYVTVNRSVRETFLHRSPYFGLLGGSSTLLN